MMLPDIKRLVGTGLFILQETNLDFIAPALCNDLTNTRFERFTITSELCYVICWLETALITKYVYRAPIDHKP